MASTSGERGGTPRVVWSDEAGDFVRVPGTGEAADPARLLSRPERTDARSAAPRDLPSDTHEAPAAARRHVVIGASEVSAADARSSGPAPAAPPSSKGAGAPASAAAASRPTRPRPAPQPRRPAPAPAPAPAKPASTGGRRKGRRGRRLRTWLVVALVALLLVPTLALLFGWYQFRQIERVDVGDVLSPGGGAGTNYLIVGSDTREGIDESDPNADAFIGSAVSGERTDTIMVLRTEGSRSFLLSIPRDLWVTNAATGEEGRINAVYRSGPQALIQTVQQSVGIPVHHYLEIDFVSFGGLVDAVGGITIDFPNPAQDPASGLNVTEAGPTTLNGAEALAYVRSRTYTELIDGTWQTDPTGDIGRTERQRQFLSALLAKATGSKNPIALARISGALGGGLAIDDTFTYFGTLALAWRLRGFDPEAVVLPTFGRTTSGGAAVLEISDGEATPLLTQFAA